MITIYIHTGASKTGTSAIQAFLNYNRENLVRDFSCLYPSFNTDAIHQGNDCHNHCRPLMKNDMRAMEKEIRRSIAFCKENAISKMILSCEGLLMEPSAGKKIFDMVRADPDLKCSIIVFIRRQDHYLESSWKQWGSKDSRFRTIDEYIEKNPIKWLDALRKYENIFGRESLVVKVYEKEQLP